MSKNKVKKVNSYTSDSDEMARMFKMLGIVVLVLGAFYLLFAIASGEISFGGKKKKEVEIQNVEIIAGETFKRAESSYYVLMYDFDNKKSADIYTDLYSLYKNYYNTTKLYIVDLGLKFSSSYVVDDPSLVNVSSIETLKVVDGTLIKVENGTGVSVAVGEENIKTELFTVK